MKRFHFLFISLLLIALFIVSCSEVHVADDKTDTDENLQEQSEPDTKDKAIDEEPEHIHSFGDWEITVTSSCTQTGEQTRKCSCGETETIIIDKLKHTIVVDSAVEPTETTTGLTEGSHCSVCGMVFTAQKILPCLSSENPSDDEPQSETKVFILNTSTHKYHLPTCSYVNALGTGNYETYEGTSEELITQGYEPCKRCCPDGSTDEEEPDNTEPEPEHIHVFSAWETTVVPSCIQSGEQIRTCACGETETQTLKQLEHTIVIDSAVSPTSMETGLTEGSHCSVCGTIIKEQEIIPCIHPDDPIIDDPEEEIKEFVLNTNTYKYHLPTCSYVNSIEQEHYATYTGTSEELISQGYEPCKRCCPDGSTDEEEPDNTEPEPEHVHVFSAWETTVVPSCIQSGEQIRTCACGETETQTLKQLEHTIVIDSAVSPTSMETGLTEGSHCSVCGTIIKEQEIIPCIYPDDPIIDDPEEEIKEFVLNTNTHKYHLPTCSYVNSIEQEHYATYTGLNKELISQGYEPCKRCHPER